VDVDIRRQHRDDDGIGILRDVGEILRRNRGGRIHDHVGRVGRDARVPRSGHARVAFEGRNAVNDRLFGRSLLEPAHARALRVIVGEHGTIATARKVAGKVRRNRRLAGTALGVQH